MTADSGKFHMENNPTLQFLAFADSEIASITFGKDNVRVLFSAAHVLHQASENGDKLAEGYARGVELILTGTYPKAAKDDFMGRLSFGRAVMEGQWLLQLPLPCIIKSRVAMELGFANQSSFEVEAIGMECRFTGEPNFFESMAC